MTGYEKLKHSVKKDIAEDQGERCYDKLFEDNAPVFLDIWKKGRNYNTIIFSIDGYGESIIEGRREIKKGVNIK